MKTLFIAFLVATVCIGKGIPLKCYTCPLAFTIEQCSHITVCKESEKYCITQHISEASEMIAFDGYSKRCSRTCPKNFEDRRSKRVVLKCCDTDGCNKD